MVFADNVGNGYTKHDGTDYISLFRLVLRPKINLKTNLLKDFAENPNKSRFANDKAARARKI